MSAPDTDLHDIIAYLGGNLRYELSKIDLKDPAEVTAAVISNWLASARLNAELNHIIDDQCYLTELGISLVRALKHVVELDDTTAQEIASSGDFDAAVVETLLAIDADPLHQACAIASLPEPDREMLEWYGVVNEDWHLTDLGNIVIDYLRCMQE